MDMDRSFLAFKQLLLRLINGPEDPKLAPKPIATRSIVRRDVPADAREDWARIGL